MLFASRNLYAEDKGVSDLLNQYLKAHSTQNTELLESCFHPRAQIAYINSRKHVVPVSLMGFIHTHRSLFRDARDVKETFSSTDIQQYQDMAIVATDYVYAVDGNEQTGRDYMILVREKEFWKIMSLVYTLKSEEVAQITEARRDRIRRLREKRKQKYPNIF